MAEVVVAMMTSVPATFLVIGLVVVVVVATSEIEDKGLFQRGMHLTITYCDEDLQKVWHKKAE